MMKERQTFLEKLRVEIDTQLLRQIRNRNWSKGRMPKDHIFKAILKTKSLVENQFGGPVKARYSLTASKVAGSAIIDKREDKVIEYLVDFSFSRFRITQTYQQQNRSAPTNPIPAGKQFEMLMCVESELGKPNEVCRDLLKLMCVKSKIKVLIYYRRVQKAAIKRLRDKIEHVLEKCAHFDNEDLWLLLEVPEHPRQLAKDPPILAHTVNLDKKIVPLSPNRSPQPQAQKARRQ